MKFIKWFFGIIFFLIISAAVGGYIFLRNFDLNRYKPMIEKTVFEKTGRQLTLAGNAELGISLIPTVIINDVSFANPDWAKNPQMVTVKTVELRVALLPLLKKQVIIDRALLREPKIYLETSKDGQSSWDIQLVDSNNGQTSAQGWIIKNAYAEETENPLGFLTDFVAREVLIEKGAVEYYQHKDKSVQKLNIDEFKLDTEGMDSPLNVSWSLLLNDMKITGNGELGSLAALFSATGEYPIKVNVKALNISAVVNAKIKNLMNDRLSASFDYNVYNPAGNFNAPETTVIGTGNATMKKVSLNIAKLDVVKNVLKGTVSADISGKKPMINADLRGETFDLRSLNTSSPTAFELNLIKSAQAAEFIPNDKIPFDLLTTANANAALKLGKLIVNDEIAIDNLVVKAVLNEGLLLIKPLTFDLGGGKADITATVNAVNQSLSVNGSTTDVVLPDVVKSLRAEGTDGFGFFSGGKTQTSFNLSGSGDNYRSLVNKLNGQVIAIAEDAKMQSGKLKYLNGNFVNQLLTMLKIDSSKVEKFDLVCAVVRADIKDGVATFPKGIAIDSDKLDIVSNGTVNLRNEKIDLSLNAFGSGFADVSVVQALSNLIKIGGKIQSPSIAVDQGGAIKTIAGVALSGGAFAGAQMLLDKDTAPCYTALSGTAFADKFPKPTGVVNATQKTYQGASDLLSSGANKLKESAKELNNIRKNLMNNLKSNKKDKK